MYFSFCLVHYGCQRVGELLKKKKEKRGFKVIYTFIFQERVSTTNIMFQVLEPVEYKTISP